MDFIVYVNVAATRKEGRDNEWDNYIVKLANEQCLM